MEKLAIDGGKPVRTKPWAPWPHFDEDEVQAVSNVLRSGKVNYWTGDIHTLENGIKVRGECGLFEKEFADYIGAKYAIALGNGTLALELALHSLNIGVGDEVIVPSRTFIASASACVMRGATPVFADIDKNSQNITVESIEDALTGKTKAIICVHLAGWACEMDEIMEFAQDHNLKIIEDCAQCFGGKYKNKMLGSIGHMSAFSFCQDKIITTGGEGGMLVTNDPELFKKAWTYKDHGKDFNKYNRTLEHQLVIESEISSSYYTSLGTNWRMTEMQAVIGRLQLSKLDGWIAKRRKYAKILNEGLKNIEGIRLTFPPDNIYHAYYKYYIFLKLDRLVNGWNREKVIEAINAEGVVCQFGSTWGVGMEEGWDQFYCSISKKNRELKLQEHFPNDSIVGNTSLMFQVHPTLDKEAIENTLKAVIKVMKVAVKI